ncbi:MAG: tRNA pseudouridine(55) synthase TruB [Spirochaetes bacterium]|nr:tRNA pseudouridine(55) synthase TruB [Spirochaetota bacterium]
MSSLDGILLLHKPQGITSFEVLQFVKRHFHTLRVGHTGTLDRFASGLLVAVVGTYTKLADLIQELEKEYKGVIEFGRETDTLDPEGVVVAHGPVPTLEDIKTQIPSFTGVILQSPPAYSAVHVAGERAYRMARRGLLVDLPPRYIKIQSLHIENYRAPFLTLRVVCSKGTYIRALARDLGRKCGSVAYLKDLIRLRIGPLQLRDAVLPSELGKKDTIYQGVEILSLLFPGRVLPVAPSSGVLQGKPLHPSLWKNVQFQEGPYVLTSPEGKLLGAVQYQAGTLSYRFVVSQKDL